jgi:hypothetical protein
MSDTIVIDFRTRDWDVNRPTFRQANPEIILSNMATNPVDGERTVEEQTLQY